MIPKVEADAAIVAAYSEGWKAALDATLEAIDRCDTRQQILQEIDTLGLVS